MTSPTWSTTTPTAMPAVSGHDRKQCHQPGHGQFLQGAPAGGQLRQIYLWARDEIGMRAPLAGQIAKGEAGANGVTYPVTVTNNGVQGGA